MSNAHDMEDNISTPIQDNVTSTVRGVTEHNDSVSYEQLYLSEAFMLATRGVIKEIDEGLSKP